jgi:hypothetical protein
MSHDFLPMSREAGILTRLERSRGRRPWRGRPGGPEEIDARGDRHLAQEVEPTQVSSACFVNYCATIYDP